MVKPVISDWRRAGDARPAKSTGLPSRLLGVLAPSTGLLDGRTFLLFLNKIKYIYIFFF